MLILPMALVACGGGTTGTSPTTHVDLRGRVLDLSGQPLANAPMTVLDQASSQELVASATDTGGEFQMALPADIEQFKVEFSGARSGLLTRSLSGAAQIAALLEVAPSGEVFVSRQLEARLVKVTGCSGVDLVGNTLTISQPNIGPQCTLHLAVRADGVIPTSGLTSFVSGSCSADEEAMEPGLLFADSGELQFSLGKLSTKGCRPSSLLITYTNASAISMEFVFKKSPGCEPLGASQHKSSNVPARLSS
jgi:hypothetical protein